MSDIEIREVGPDDFRKGILAGEVKPHSVEMILKYQDGRAFRQTVSWDIIRSLYEYHNKCAVGECYELMVENNL